jgi:3-oxoacyl-[acyl-carrier protein] reductase
MSHVAVVTGSARGIGAAIAGRLARDGAAVAVLAPDLDAAAVTAAGIQRAGGRAIAVHADVCDADVALAAVEEVASRLGRPAILVNNAEIGRDTPSPGGWDFVLDVNLRGTFVMTRAVADHMVKVGWGRVVNLPSVAAGQAGYLTAKAGIEGLTKTLALELGPLNITVNSVVPGCAGRPGDIASVVSFLAGERTSFVSGQVIHVAGGSVA